ncbi:MAG: hypothetical protein Q7J16_03010 [Candidatus Cloacimonadales bacterium]|nr:hypothetical protein [Candidatus Cloacimonadales bacterium]
MYLTMILFLQWLNEDQAGTKKAPSWNQAQTKLGPSRDQVEIMRKCFNETPTVKLMKIVGRSNRTKFRDQVINPLIEEQLIEMTIPDKPRSKNQKYRLTEKGKRVLRDFDNAVKKINADYLKHIFIGTEP